MQNSFGYGAMEFHFADNSPLMDLNVPEKKDSSDKETAVAALQKETEPQTHQYWQDLAFNHKSRSH